MPTATELDPSVLEQLDFAPPCDYRRRPQPPGRGSWICPAPAKWIVWISSCHKHSCIHDCIGHMLCDFHKELVASGNFFCIGCGSEQRARRIEAL